MVQTKNIVKPLFSLSLDTLKNLPDAISIEDKVVVLDNSTTPFIGLLTDAWKQTPVQIDTILTIFCLSGDINVRIAFENYVMNQNSVCIISPGTIVEILSISESFKCIMLVIQKDHVNLEQNSTLQIMQLFKYIQRVPCTLLTGIYADRYRETIMETVRTAKWADNPLRPNMLLSYIYLLFCCLYPVLVANEEMTESEIAKSHNRSIYYKFMELLQNNYREHRTVSYYAKILKLTPKYISKVVLEESGRSALKWIEDYVLLESKALLKQNDLNIRTVSERMNFPNQSTFGKFFHRLTGMSPKEYKEG